MAKTILVVEDEQALQKTLGDTLNEAGFTTLSALDGEIGLRLAKEKKPDLILLDLVLPRINGFEVLGALKTDQETSAIPVIVLTNLEEMKDVEQALASGATTYLVKANYTMQDVLDKVRKALNEN